MAADEQQKYVTNAELKDKLEKVESKLKLWIVFCTIAAPFVPAAALAAPVFPAVTDVAASAIKAL